VLLIMGLRERISLRFEYLRVREYRSNAWKDFMNECHILNVKVASNSDG
jgi:hypothetical protein